MSRVQSVFENECVEVLARKGGSAFTLLTFGIMHSRADGASFWGMGLADRLDLDCIAVMPKSPNWYPPAAMKGAVKAIRKIREKPVLGYGASMGAYAVLRYGKPLGLQTALAFAPQASIDPGLLGPEDRRYAKFFRPDWHEGEKVRARTLPQQSFVLYDPFMAQDRLNAGLLPRSKSITPIKLPFMGHKTVMSAASVRVAEQMFALALAGDASGLSRLLLPRRRLQPEYFRQMATEFVARGQMERAQLVAKLGFGRGPYDGDLHRIRAHCFGQLGRIEEALEASQQASALHPDDRRIQLQLAKLYIQAGQHASAVEVLEAMAPKDHIISLSLATAYEQLGDFANALVAMDAAREALPDNVSLMKRRAYLQGQLDRAADDPGPDEAKAETAR